MSMWEPLEHDATVAQLAGVDAIMLIGMIVQVANMARLHKKNCIRFAEYLKVIGDLLEELKFSELKRHPATGEPLKKLEDTLRRSYILVNRFQNRSYPYLLAKGWYIVHQFREAQNEIGSYLNLISLINLVHTNRIKERLEYIKTNQSEYALDDEEMQDFPKFRVKFLSEGFGQKDMDVLCQVGLDRILILEPATSMTLKMYPLEAVTRWEVLDSYIFAFWTKTSVDIETRRVRLKSNPCTTNDILDTVTAASIQVKEIVDVNNPSYSTKDHWVPDEAVAKYISSAAAFNGFVGKEEMEKNRKSSTGVCVTSNGSGKLTREVACPTCTVHLQVEVPATGSETIECSVCQHLFKVSIVY